MFVFSSVPNEDFSCNSSHLFRSMLSFIFRQLMRYTVFMKRSVHHLLFYTCHYIATAEVDAKLIEGLEVHCHALLGHLGHGTEPQVPPGVSLFLPFKSLRIKVSGE